MNKVNIEIHFLIYQNMLYVIIMRIIKFFFSKFNIFVLKKFKDIYYE